VENGVPRLELVLLRWLMDYRYSSIVGRKWTPFEDMGFNNQQGDMICSKRPENRRFEVTERGTVIGSIVVHTCKLNEFYHASTPWGELEIRRSGLARYEVSQGPNLIGTVKERLSGRTAVVSFPLGQELRFKGSMLGFSNMEAETEAGRVSIAVESGHRPNPGPSQHKDLKRKDYALLAENDKTAIVETDQWVQWRIALFGSLPARDDDILKALAMDLCRNRLYSEYVAALA